MKRKNMEFTCRTEDCIHWEAGGCKHPAAITIQKHCCTDYEFKRHALTAELQTRKFASPERMVEIANNAIDSFGELLNGRMLYDALAGSLKMDDAEILAAGFTTLREFMGENDNDKE
ncbi:hypothetical protein D7V91_11715 [bacterium 1xD42-67]|nr:hypothetical protein D7V91_11715 [bacterium 1xD42-67]